MILDFNKIEKKYIRSLIDIRLSYSSADINFIRDRYNDDAIHFEQIFLFLVQSNIFKDDGSLRDHNSKKLRSAIQNDHLFDQFLINILLNKKSVYNDYVSKYLGNFELKNNELTYKPFSKERIKYSGIRNLFSEVGFLNLGQNYNYHINTAHNKKILRKRKQSVITPNKLKSILDKQNQIGLSAELRIIVHEQDRLKKLGINNDLEHVALENVSLGYDIKSWESAIDERYIEVKAVSILDYKFHWSKNEIEVSEKFGEKYYLYLLPVIDSETFDIDSLVIVKDPYNEIFSKDTEYQKEPEQYSVWK